MFVNRRLEGWESVVNPFPKLKSTLQIFTVTVIVVTIAAMAQTPGTNSSPVIQGVVQSKQVPLPGAVVVARKVAEGVDGVAAVNAVTEVNGQYTLKVPGPGRYRVTVEMTLFTPSEREVEINDPSKPFVANFELGLLARTERPATVRRPAGNVEQESPATPSTEDDREALLTAELQTAPLDIALLPGMSANGATESVAV